MRGPLIGLHAGARDSARRWPPERFATVGAALDARYGGSVTLLGDAQTAPASARIAERLERERIPCLDLTGRTSLPALGAVIARLALLVTNDSGPAHIAYALGAPSVTIFGGANLEAYGPPEHDPHWLAIHDVACCPGGSQTCQTCAYNYACLDGVSVSHVVALAERALAGTNTERQRRTAAR